MIRVVQVITTLNPAGAENLLVELCRALPAEGVEPHVASLLGPGPLSEALTASGVPQYDLSRGGLPGPWSFSKLARAILGNRIDIVHTHLPHAGIVGKLSAAATNRISITTRHYDTDLKIGTPLFRLEDRLIDALAARLISISEYAVPILIERRVASREKIAICRNAIDVGRFTSLAGQRSTGPPTVGTVGRMESQKAQHVFLDAVAEIRKRRPATRAVLVGDGRLRTSLEAHRSRLGLDDIVEFTGVVAAHEIPRIVASFDVFLLTSDWEGLPVVLIEAAALGVPVVATNVNGVPEVVQDGVTGFLVPPRDPLALADRTIRLLDDEVLRRGFSEAARARAENEFDISRLARQTATLYREVLAERGRPY